MNPLQKAISKIPEGYTKSIIKNFSSFVLSFYPQPIEKVKVDGIWIKMTKDNVINNKLLAKEVGGYTTYYKIKEGDIVIDAGAYTGLFTIYAAKKVGEKGKVIAYEPNYYNKILLNKNLKLNKINNVIVRSKGLFSKKAKVAFDIQSVGSNIVDLNNVFHGRKTINKINVDTLDNEVKNLKLSKVNFVKMDIEGAEIDAVKGMKKILDYKKINLAIASYHIVNEKETKYFLEKFFKSKKMKAFTKDHGQLTTYIKH